MDQRISLITLGVTNLARSRAFYEALGWQRASDDTTPEIAAYDLLGMSLALYPIEKLVDDLGIDVSAGSYMPVTLGYNVASDAEVDTILDTAVKAGATLIKSGEKVFWGGYSGFFADPDRNLWEVSHNPFSKLGSKGEFQWNGVD